MSVRTVYSVPCTLDLRGISLKLGKNQPITKEEIALYRRRDSGAALMVIPERIVTALLQIISLAVPPVSVISKASNDSAVPGLASRR